jgi:(4S)-4-hydroxy-5-phosphonooxypentane-2,3-dione isomerase
MYIMHVSIRVKPECVDAFIEATLANARGSVKEPGVARFDVIQELEDPSLFKLVEVYRSEADVAKHKETEHFKAWFKVAEPMMAEARTRVFYRNIFPEDAGW